MVLAEESGEMPMEAKISTMETTKKTARAGKEVSAHLEKG